MDFESTIHDDADVIFVSFGQDAPLSDDTKSFFHEPVTFGSHHTTIHGVPIVCSTNNSGPYDDTVINTAPWVIIVAATTVDRDFPNILTLGNIMRLRGTSLMSTTRQRTLLDGRCFLRHIQPVRHLQQQARHRRPCEGITDESMINEGGII